MNVLLDIVVLEMRPGLWRASLPWAGPLAEPSTGPHRTAVVEDLLYRVAENLVRRRRFSSTAGTPSHHDDGRDAVAPNPRNDGKDAVAPITPARRDLLAGPDGLRTTDVDVTIERQVREDRPSVELEATVPVALGTHDDGLFHAWIPTAPGACIALRDTDDLTAAVTAWASDWADANDAETLDELAGGEAIDIETTELELPDFGATASPPSSGEFGATASLPSSGATASPPSRTTSAFQRLLRPETLQEAATNLTHLAAEDKTLRAYGRDAIVGELVDAITGVEPSHICLVGPAGAGKTAIIEEAVGRAWSLQQDYQQRRDVWRTGGNQMIAGTRSGGQWQDRAAGVCRELARRDDLLVVDELAEFALAGPDDGDSNLAHFFEPEMADAHFSVVAEATERTLDRVRQEVPGFVDLFRLVRVPAMDRRETYGVADAFVRELEAELDVAFSPAAIEAAVELCDRYFRGEVLPGTAVRLLQTCARDARRPRIATTDVAQTVHRETGLPRRILDAHRGRPAAPVRESFESRVFGQSDASAVVAGLVPTIEAGLARPDQPFASLLLIGPTGVGKTETAKALADEVYDSPHRLTRFDMSEFGDPESVSRLIGSREDPEGELTGRVRTQPHTVLLFDEIEKAHRDVLDLLLQILGGGRLTDAAGRSVDFGNTVVAMTSNLGADQAEGRDREHYRDAAEAFFRPEFFNRIDRVVTYRPLGRGTLRRIARRALGDILQRRGLQQPNILVDVSPDLVDYLVDDAEGRRYGARTLEHRIERRLLTPLARQLTRHAADAELTRVRIVPGEDRDIDLQLTTIHPAEPVEESPDHPRPTADPEPRIERLISQIAALRDSDEMAALEERHDDLLEAFNVAEAGASDAGEALRQCEIVRGQYADLEDRTRDLFGEEAPDEPELPDLGAHDQTRRHKWHERLDELRDHLLWARTQLEVATERRVDAGTLIVRGLAGPTDPLVELWWGLVAAFADRWDVECALATADQGRWSPAGGVDLDHPPDLGGDGEGPRTLAVSAEHPGIRRIFALLAGYVWAPKPPTHGRHALMLAKHREWGTSDPDTLADRLGGEPDEAGEARLEFRLEEGKLYDLRLEDDYTSPGVGAGGFPEFAHQVIFRRLEALHGAETRKNSGC